MIREFNRAGTTGLVVEETSEGYYLYSFPEAGIEGDTWHPTIQEAKEQATYQFGLLDLEWAAVPDDVADLRSFGRQISN